MDQLNFVDCKDDMWPEISVLLRAVHSGTVR